jgi:hypothetical protein
MAFSPVAYASARQQCGQIAIMVQIVVNEGLWPADEDCATATSGFIPWFSGGGPPGIRTLNQWIKSPLLCR